MVTLKPSVLRQQAEESLQAAAYNPRKWVLIHTAVSLGSSLLVAILSFILNQQIAGTGGLSGMGLRSILSTLQSLLNMAVTVAVPFWNIALVYAALQWVDGEPAGPESLVQGFRRFVPVLALRFLNSAIYTAIFMAVFYISMTIFWLTPFSQGALKIVESIFTETMTQEEMLALFTPELLLSLTKACVPALILCGVGFAALAIPVFYRLRFVEFSVMDGEGGFNAVIENMRMNKGYGLQLFKLDLHFWWFYLLQFLSVALCYGDTILPLFGITLPISQDVAFFLFYALGILMQGLLLWLFQATVSGTYARAYRELDCA